jgi:zinc transport system substrate-binding protein
MLFRRTLALLAGVGLALSAQAQTPQVLTTIKPLQLIAAAVLDGIEKPAVLLPPGASPHTYALRPSERRAVDQAARIYWVGPDMEMFLEQLLTQRQVAVSMMDAPDLTTRQMAQPLNFQQQPDNHGHAHKHDHGHERNAAPGHAHGDHHHAPGSLDAHIWLSPDNAVAMARLMTEDLATLLPDHAERLQSNLALFEGRMQALDEELKARLTPLQGKPYFVFHDAYGYFEDHYGLGARGVFSLSHEVQPGARHVNMLRQQLRDAGPSCVFSEPQFTPRLVDSLTQGLPVRRAELDPLASEQAVSSTGYEEALRDLSNRLAGCLEGL